MNNAAKNFDTLATTPVWISYIIILFNNLTKLFLDLYLAKNF